ncbi:hypothetical protein K388_03940 [Streptomyces sp. KhCrAH-43]|nr:hypothetical protein K388_03940 [Streptomyces sp. KhCrAH-43]
MPSVGWTLEQRAAVKRYMRFSAVLSAVGVVLSIVLILIGNARGWLLLGLIVCMYGATYIFIRYKAKSQP